MVPNLDVLLSVVGLAFSIAGYLQGLHSTGWRGWYKSIWLPVVLSLTILVVVEGLHLLAVYQAAEDIVSLLVRKPRQSIHQIYAEVLPPQTLDVIAEALELLHGNDRVHVERLTFNVPDNAVVTVDVYAIAR